MLRNLEIGVAEGELVHRRGFKRRSDEGVGVSGGLAVGVSDRVREGHAGRDQFPSTHILVGGHGDVGFGSWLLHTVRFVDF